MLSVDEKTSPMMAQWHACKAKAKDAIVLFRLGDFYEAFYEDAILLAKELELTLTKRQDVPMSGIPHHTSDSYIDKLISKGFKVAVAEQLENPKDVKGIVKREIVRVITPGSIVNSQLLSDKTNNYLASLTKLNSFFGLSILDLTTGEFRVSQIESERDLLDELVRMQPKEIVVSEKCKKNHSSLLQSLSYYFPCVLTNREDWRFDHRITLDLLLQHFSVHNLDGFGLQGMTVAINAAGALLQYIRDDLFLPISHIKEVLVQKTSEYMSIDLATQRNLELTSSLHDRTNQSCLLYLLDQTCTPMGGRLLRQWITHPLLSSLEIKKRQDGVADFVSFQEKRQNLSGLFDKVRDLERLGMKVSTGFANPRDLLALRFSFEQLPMIKESLRFFSSELINHQTEKLHDLTELTEEMKRALVENPPLRIGEGILFQRGYHEPLDTYYEIKDHSEDWIFSYQARLREETGIKTLKIGFTKAFGYYIEVSRGQSDKMPSSFERRQTLVNGERFISPELKEYEYKVLTAEEKILELEKELFDSLRRKIAEYHKEIKEIAEAIGNLDCLLSLAKTGVKYRFTRPLVDDSDTFMVEEGRHPIIEASIPEGCFIPNSVLFTPKERLHLITGPNMAGKSTFLRQVALIAIMAQMGSMVPAKYAHIGIIDKVFSRIGASDDLSRGKSTFMVEMTETAAILHHATSKSLVILDEIGRGTSTYDGISIAWAVAEFLLTSPEKQAKTLFATHYWELTTLEEKFNGASNYKVAVQESNEGIVFLHKIIKGGTDKSYGIHVARLAGLPYGVLKSAQEMLLKMENQNHQPSKPGKSQRPKQLSLFGAPVSEETKQELIISDLQKIDPNYLTPVEALRKIMEWKNSLGTS